MFDSTQDTNQSHNIIKVDRQINAHMNPKTYYTTTTTTTATDNPVSNV